MFYFYQTMEMSQTILQGFVSWGNKGIQYKNSIIRLWQNGWTCGCVQFYPNIWSLFRCRINGLHCTMLARRATTKLLICYYKRELVWSRRRRWAIYQVKIVKVEQCMNTVWLYILKFALYKYIVNSGYLVHLTIRCIFLLGTRHHLLSTCALNRVRDGNERSSENLGTKSTQYTW